MTITTTHNVTFQELNEGVEYTFENVYDAAYSALDAETAMKKQGDSIHVGLANLALTLHMECKVGIADTSIAMKDKPFQGKQDNALNRFLYLCDVQEVGHKKKHNTTKIPRSITQAKSDIKGAWLLTDSEGGDLQTFKTTSMMRKKSKEEKEAQTKAQLLAGEAQGGAMQMVSADDASTKGTASKDTIKIEGIDPNSELGREVKALMDNIVAAHNNAGGTTDDKLAEAVAGARTKVGKTIAWIAQNQGKTDQAA